MEPLVIRDQHLESLSHFSARLAGALLQAGAPTGDELSTVLKGECLQCGMQVDGLEILQLAEPVEKPEDTSKLGRLRFAYCGRKGCKSYFYKLKFFPHPRFDWSNILGLVDEAPGTPSPEDKANQECADAARILLRRRFAMRVCGLAAGMVLLLIGFQWYNGGTIPFVRTPEKFTVDPMPQLSRMEMDE